MTARATTPDGRTDESIGAVSIEGLKGDSLANALMKAECVPLDAEILTGEGFRFFADVKIGDEVLAYDTETDQCRWTALENVTVYDNAPVSLLSTAEGQFQVRCTPDHSWAVMGEPYKSRVGTDPQRGQRGPYKNRQP